MSCRNKTCVALRFVCLIVVVVVVVVVFVFVVVVVIIVVVVRARVVAVVAGMCVLIVACCSFHLCNDYCCVCGCGRCRGNCCKYNEESSPCSSFFQRLLKNKHV